MQKNRYALLERAFLRLRQTKVGGGNLNKKYRKNIEKQKDIQKKIEELKLKQEMLKEEQVEMENTHVLKEYRSIDISIDEFLEMMRNYKKEKQREKKIKDPGWFPTLGWAHPPPQHPEPHAILFLPIFPHAPSIIRRRAANRGCRDRPGRGPHGRARRRSRNRRLGGPGTAPADTPSARGSRRLPASP